MGNHRPDIVVANEGMATLIDAQVVSEGLSLDENHRMNASKYREVVGLCELLASLVNVEEAVRMLLSSTNATIFYRGLASLLRH